MNKINRPEQVHVKKYLVLGFNALSAGTSEMVANFVAGLADLCPKDIEITLFAPRDQDPLRHLDKGNRNDKLRLITLPISRYLALRYIQYAFHYLAYVPLVSLLTKPDVILSLGNFLPIGFAPKRAILLHHPYTIDKEIARRLSFGSKIREFFRKLFLVFSLARCNLLIVQTNHVREKFCKEYGWLERILKFKIKTLRSPISSVLRKKAREHFSERENFFLYVARYYPHKNHEFILRFAKQHYSVLKKHNIRFVFTLREKEAKRIEQWIKAEGLEEIIFNIGEVSHNELARWYGKSRALIFPSRTETFGIPIVEAMAFGLPLLVADMDYARELCGNAGLYFSLNEGSELLGLLLRLCTDATFFGRYSYRSRKRIEQFPMAHEWVQHLLNMVGR